MPQNFNALFRHRILDACLSNPDSSNTWINLQDKIEKESLSAGIKSIRPSRRTILKDIAEMRSGVLGYSAPIAYNKPRGYHYTNPQFSIHNIPLSPTQIRNIKELIISLKSILNIKALQTVYQDVLVLGERLNILDDEIIEPIIHFDKQDDYIGAVWMDELYQHIKRKQALSLTYQAFLEEEKRLYLSPLLLKAYNKRWYLIAFHHESLKIMNLPLDRIMTISESLQPYQAPDNFDYDMYIRDVYGVTKNIDQKPIDIQFTANPLLSEYLRTKPIHRSQKIRINKSGKSLIYLRLIPNFEIKHLLRGYGSELVIINPKGFLD